MTPVKGVIWPPTHNQFTIYRLRTTGLDSLSSWMEKPQHPRSSECLFIQLNREGNYCIELNKDVGFMVYSWTRMQVQLTLVGTLSVGDQSSGCEHQGRESHSGHFLHILSTFILGPAGFSFPLRLTKRRLGHSHRAEALGLLPWSFPCQPIHIHSGLSLLPMGMDDLRAILRSRV